MTAWHESPLASIVRIRKGTIAASKRPDTLFELHSIPAFDCGSSQLVVGRHIGSSKTIVAPNDVLFSKLNPRIPRVWIVRDRHNSAALQLASTEFWPLMCDRDLVDSRFLRHLLLWTGFRERFIGSTEAATRSRSRLRPQQLLSQQVLLPPLSEQRRIVEILDQADALRKKSAEADAKAARILPALFCKMFGDPATNPMGWPIMRIRDLSARISDGPFGSNLKTEHYMTDGVRVVRLQNIGVGAFLDDDRAYISQEHFQLLSRHKCVPGDVLVGTMGDPNLRACVVPTSMERAINKADCVQIRPDDTIATSEYLCWLLNLPSTLNMAATLVAGQTRSRISMGRLAQLYVPVPPIAEQRVFSRWAAEVRAFQSSQTQCLRHVERLFKSLTLRAFTGDLTANWRTAHIKELLVEMEIQARYLDKTR